MLKIKKGDTVIVTAGKDKGKQGTVEKVLYVKPKYQSKHLNRQKPDSVKLVVSGVNMAKKHVKPTQQNPDGGIIEKNMPIDVSNVAIFNVATGKADRVGFKFLEDGSKVRIFKSTKEEIEV